MQNKKIKLITGLEVTLKPMSEEDMKMDLKSFYEAIKRKLENTIDINYEEVKDEKPKQLPQ